MGEEATADHRVTRSMELEEEELARLESPEDSGPARLPEVHVVELRTTREKLVPLVVRDSDVCLHRQTRITPSRRASPAEERLRWDHGTTRLPTATAHRVEPLLQTDRTSLGDPMGGAIAARSRMVTWDQRL